MQQICFILTSDWKYVDSSLISPTANSFKWEREHPISMGQRKKDVTHWSYAFFSLSLQYRNGSILLNCAITKENQPKIEYHDQFLVKNISRNLQNTCFISGLSKPPWYQNHSPFLSILCYSGNEYFGKQNHRGYINSISRWGTPRRALEAYYNSHVH